MEVFLYNANIALTLVVFLLHLTFTRSNYAANRLLSVFLFGCFYTSLMLVLYNSKWIFNFPHFYRTGAICLYVLFPAAYLYTRKIVDQEGWARKDLFHLIPVLVYLFDYSPFFLLSGPEKTEAVRNAFDTGGLFSFSETLILPEYFHFYGRALLALFYLFLMGRICYRRFVGKANAAFRQDNRLLMQWLFLLVTLLTVETLTNAISMLSASQTVVVWYSTIVVYMANLVIVLFLLFHPQLIYGVKGLWLSEVGIHDETAAEVKQGSDGRVYLKEEHANRIGEAIDSVLLNNRKFLVKGYCMQDLVRDTGYSSHQLSVYINTYLGKNFKEYLNGLRVDHLLQEVDRKKGLEFFTVDALADLAGFSNRFSFLQSFKKVTGETPSGLMRRRRHSE